MAEKDKKEQAERTPLGAFVHHQGRALEETGKAFIALLPKGFREHAETALDESKQGFEVLIDEVIDTVDSGLDRLRRKPKDKASKDKVKVKVD